MEREDFLKSVEEKDERLEALKQLYPEIFSDSKINLDAFKDATGTSDLPEDEDKTPGYYGLYWPGKRAAKQLAKKPATGTLEPVPGDGVNEDTTHNIYIEGDNLEVLRTLRNSYRGRVKMIYIDPPYNTGKDFIYPDNFKTPIEEYLKFTHQVDEKGNKLVTNVKSNGRFHTNWLSMIYSRLLIARDLLTEDGVILINIDENEVSNLHLLCNEIFYEENDLGSIIWDKRNPKGDSQGIASQHETIHVFAKNKQALLKNTEITRPKKNAKLILDKAKKLFSKISQNYTLDQCNSDFNEWMKSNKNDFSGGELAYDRIDEYGNVYQPVSMSWPNKKKAPDNYFIPLIHPITKKNCPVPEKGWRNPPKTMQELLNRGEILFGKDEKTQPRRKYLLKDNLYENIPSLLYYGGSDTDMLASMGIPFDTPKVVDICREHIKSFTNNDSIILDFFSGSCTTAHAVMQLNAEDENSHRKFIMVQLPVNINNEVSSGGELYKTICDIGKTRIRKSGKLILNSNIDNDAYKSKIDIGFKVYRLSESNFTKFKPIKGRNKEILNEIYESFEAMIDPLIDGWKPENVLEEIKLRQGFALDCRVEVVKDISSNKIWHLTDPERQITLYVCLDEKIEQETVEALNVGKDDRFICLNSAIDDTTYARLADKNRIQTL